MSKTKRFNRYEKEVPKPIKTVFEEPKKGEEKPVQLFSTSDSNVASKLQDKFQIDNITYDSITEKRNFTFKATVDEVNTFLKGG
jgi:hypothetical protein